MDTNPLEDFENMDVNKIQDTLQKVNFAAGKQAENTLRSLVEHALKKGIMPKTALRIGDDTMEAIYTQAYNLYNQGKYKESSYIFRLLMMLDALTPKYHLGLAACMHRTKDFVNATNMYLLCAALDQKNPMPHYHSADCYLQMDAIELAILALQMAITTAGDQQQYAVLKERSILLKSALEKQAQERAEKLSKTAKPEEKTPGTQAA